jgi:hypothetical protein
VDLRLGGDESGGHRPLESAHQANGELESYRELLFDAYSNDGFVLENILLRANWVVECRPLWLGDDQEKNNDINELSICKTCLPEALLAVEYGPTWNDIGDHLGPFPISNSALR